MQQANALGAGANSMPACCCKQRSSVWRIALGREFIVADALRDDLLVSLFEQKLAPDAAYASHFLVYPTYNILL